MRPSLPNRTWKRRRLPRPHRLRPSPSRFRLPRRLQSSKKRTTLLLRRHRSKKRSLLPNPCRRHRLLRPRLPHHQRYLVDSFRQRSAFASRSLVRRRNPRDRLRRPSARRSRSRASCSRRRLSRRRRARRHRLAPSRRRLHHAQEHRVSRVLRMRRCDQRRRACWVVRGRCPLSRFVPSSRSRHAPACPRSPVSARRSDSRDHRAGRCGRQRRGPSRRAGSDRAPRCRSQHRLHRRRSRARSRLPRA